MKLFRDFWLLAFVAVFLGSCASKHGAAGDGRRAEVPDEVSLRADRSALDDERRDIPEDRRRENDELALVFQMMQAKKNQEPGEVHDRFNKALRDRRDKNDKALRKRREEFTRVEKHSRDEFLRKSKDERDSYMGGKHTSDERKRFFDDQEDKRKNYFAGESEKRTDFESEMTDARKTFEDYVKEKTNEFNDEIRAYTADYYDRKKNEALQKTVKEKERSQARDRGRTQPNELNEFDSIPAGPGIPLGAPTGH